jgi:anaerobic selenocysteine-containing dehydrogenase
LVLSEQAVDAPEQASSTFQFWTDLGRRMGFAEHFPWDHLEQLLDHRLEPSGRTFASFAASTVMEQAPPEFRKYRKVGFATPSGKVELSSSILAELGFDPLPYHREAPDVSAEYPYRVFTGVREDPFFQTGQRNIRVLRRRSPSPKLFVHPTDAARDGLVEGQWARLETATGAVVAKVALQPNMLPGHVRVPHGWWYPETRGSLPLAGAFVSSDAVLCSDADEFLDAEQGIPHFKGFAGRVVPCDAPEHMSTETLEG